MSLTTDAVVARANRIAGLEDGAARTRALRQLHADLATGAVGSVADAVAGALLAGSRLRPGAPAVLKGALSAIVAPRLAQAIEGVWSVDAFAQTLRHLPSFDEPTDPKAPWLAAARRAGAKIGPRGVSQLLRLLDTPSHAARAAVVEALIGMGPRIRPALYEAQKGELSSELLAVLGAVGDVGDYGYLQSLLPKGFGAAHALHRLTLRFPTLRERTIAALRVELAALAAAGERPNQHPGDLRNTLWHLVCLGDDDSTVPFRGSREPEVAQLACNPERVRREHPDWVLDAAGR